MGAGRTRDIVEKAEQDPGQSPEDPPAGPSRRSVLRAAAVTGSTIVVAGTGALGYRVFDQAVLDPDRGHAFDPWPERRDADGPLGAVAAAILAANPHNSQPWAFHIADTSIDVYADRSRHTGILDTLGRELHVGLGCAVENLVIAARARGLAPTVTLLPSGPGSDLVAHVALDPVAPEPSALDEAIDDRHTNRGPFKTMNVPAGVLADLVDATGLPGVRVHWVTDDTEKAALGRLMVDAAVAVTGDDQQSRDSFAWFRSSADAIQRHRDGLTLDGQGLSPLMLTLAKLLPASSRAAGDKFWVNQTRDVHTKTAAAYGVITVTDPYDVTAQLVGGRLLQRIHLTATSHGIALHHMNQITERIDRERTIATQPTFAPRFARLLPTGVHPLVSFRIGYPVRDARLSPRRPLAAVTR